MDEYEDACSHVQRAGLQFISVCCVHHSLHTPDTQLTERQALTLDYSRAEEAALGLAARSSRALTGPGLNHPLHPHTGRTSGYN